ncbi:lectin-like domain-containing protein [Companilactobacillus mishanensis]|uniref:WxL domain-containing protein n=1 Tax=Companilactobacillus mishanensis TaxID=2486008 RepID=A0A5P0ZG20_9LACO|nr:hypothetical protein [Companilactobacillus mishanensis]MQS52001.1 hypothetical protein [Companilactobacillus mishanensis]
MGLNIADYFKLGDFPENNAKILDGNSVQRSLSSILQVTDGPGQTGAIWSDLEPDNMSEALESNYIDISKDQHEPQTLSMWLYFGKGKNGHIGDGMAFVLQNDPNGIKAISRRKSGKVGDGQTLGVWGYDYKRGMNLTEADIATRAIQNSFAIEFDTFPDLGGPNTSNQGGVSSDIDKGNSFDFGLSSRPSQHIFMGYPDNADTYEKHNFGFVLRHDNLQLTDDPDTKHKGQLTDGTWHHMTITWTNLDDKNANLKYELNDKNNDGSKNRSPENYISSNAQVDLTHFKKPASNRLRWGFTGSTGDEFENNLIIFESVPSFLSGNVEPSIRDDTQNMVISDEFKSVYEGDDLTFNYKLNYQSGPKDWEKIKSLITLPSQVKFQSAEVIYPYGKTEVISQDSFNQKDSKLTYVLQKNLNSKLETATIRIHANAQTLGNNIGTAHGRFESKYLILDGDTHEFDIVQNSLTIKTDPAEGKNFQDLQSIKENQKIAVYVNKNDLTALPDTTLYYKIKGKTNLKTITGLERGKAAYIEIDKGNFEIGQNILEIYAVDNQTKERSRTVKLEYNVGRDLRFGDVSEEVYFQQINEGYKDELVRRKKGWKVEVIDNRSTGNPWKLYAEAVALSKDGNTNQQLDADLIFKHKAGNIDFLESGPMIDFGPSVVPGKKSTQITDHWSKDDGVLLKLNGRNKKGTYKTQICWSLYDTI